MVKDIEYIRREIVNNRLSYYELLNLYIEYLILRRNEMNSLPSYRKDRVYYSLNKNSNGLWSCKNGQGGNIIKKDEPNCIMGYRLVKKLTIGR